MNAQHRPRLSLSFCLLLIGLLAAASTIACSSSSPSPDDTTAEAVAEEPEIEEPTAQEYFLQANEKLDERQWEEAIALYEKVTAADPERWDAHMNRGIALTHSSEFRAATEAFAQSLEAGGDQESLVYFNLGNHYQERSLHEHAIDAYRSAMALRGEVDYETLLNIGAAFTFLNAHDEARETIERAIAIDPDDPRGHITLGLLEYSAGHYDVALNIYDELVAYHPNMATAHFNRGYVLQNMNEDAEALQAFSTYIELAPNGPYVENAESSISLLERRLEERSK